MSVARHTALFLILSTSWACSASPEGSPELEDTSPPPAADIDEVTDSGVVGPGSDLPDIPPISDTVSAQPDVMADASVEEVAPNVDAAPDSVMPDALVDVDSGDVDSGDVATEVDSAPDVVVVTPDVIADVVDEDTPSVLDVGGDSAVTDLDILADGQGEDVEPGPLCSEEVVAACDDGDPCNGFEGCDEETGDCTPGTPLCDDGNPCTVDICDAVVGFCDVESVDCGDGNPCTDDTCDIKTGACQHEDADCSDGDLCTNDWCAPPAGGCFWDAVACDDDDPCTNDACDPEVGCVYTPKECDDGVACTLDGCTDGQCDHEPDPQACDDEDPCTDDTCHLTTGCVSVTDPCDDSIACTQDGCIDGECVHEPNAGACDDQDACTTDVCDVVEGCKQEAVDCDDGSLCTLDECQSTTGVCDHEPVDCDNGDACDGVETCDPTTGQCLEGVAVTCVDDDACDGLDACDPATGACVTGEPVDCYAATPDWDGCDGVKTCQPDGSCVTESVTDLACPVAPGACGQSGGTDGPQSGKVTTGPGSVFILRDQMQWDDKTALADQIASHWSVETVPLSTVVNTDLNRQGGGISLDGIDCFKDGFWWNDGDNDVDYWWPQGVTGSGDAWGSPGTVGGKALLVVSWYHKAEEDSGTSTYKGVRVAVVDLLDYSYRLMLLAEPVCEGTITNGECDGLATYEPLASSSSSLHAGGIVWYQNYLYVADTSHGFRVFDMTRIQQVQTGDSNTLGYKSSAAGYHAYNYRYVIPQVGRYQHCGDTCCARFSWVSLDPTTSPPSLLAGEYVSGSTSGRAHRWSLDGETGRLLTSYGTATSVASYFPAVENMQGGLSVDGHFFFSSSAAKTSWPVSLGSMHDAPLGGSLTTHQWPLLPEDLYYEPVGDMVWTCTEQPSSWMGQTRYCFGAEREDLVNNSCD